MATLSDVQDLNYALHRKLLNINEDIRQLRKSKYPDNQKIKELKQHSKEVDKILNKSVQLFINFEKTADAQEQYNEYHKFYQAS